MDGIQKHIQMLDEVNKKIARLKEIVAEEGMELSEDSEQNFYEFLERAWVVRCPYLYILETGFLNAVWRSPNVERISVTFTGDSKVDYLIVSKYYMRAGLGWEAGSDSLLGIKERIQFRGLLGMLQESN